MKKFFWLCIFLGPFFSVSAQENDATMREFVKKATIEQMEAGCKMSLSKITDPAVLKEAQTACDCFIDGFKNKITDSQWAEIVEIAMTGDISKVETVMFKHVVELQKSCSSK